MAITVYADIVLSDRIIRAGIRGRQMRRNARTQTSNGRMQANVLWSQTLREYEVGIVPMKVGRWQELENIFEVTDGGAYGFLLQDPKDNTVTTATGIIKRTSGTYQMYKRYAVGNRYVDRKITRPIAGATIYVDGGVVAATYSTTTGVVTWSESPGGDDTYTWAGSFYTPVHFQSDQIDWEMVRPDPDVADRLIAGPTSVLQEIRE